MWAKIGIQSNNKGHPYGAEKKFASQGYLSGAALITGFFSVLSLSLVHAEAPETGVVRLEAITVTGEKTDRSLQDTVSSVGVITAEDIEDGNMVDFNDVFDRLVNVSTAFGGDGFSIRGINNGTIAGGHTTSSGLASMYLDGVFVAKHGIQAGQKQLWDIEQVEVFRGPQSTVQGRNALAGTVVVRSKDPSFDWTADARLLYDDLESMGASAAFGGPLIKDELAFRIAVDYQNSDGFVENPTRDDDDYADSKNKLIRGKLLYEPMALPGFSALLTLSLSENESGDDAVATRDPAGNLIDPFKRKNFSNIDGFENSDQSIFALNLTYEMSPGLRLESVTAYNRNEYERQDDDDQTPDGGDNMRTRENDTNTFSQEFRLHFEQDRWRGLAGAYYFDQDADDVSRFVGAVDLASVGVPPVLLPFYTNPFPTSRDAYFDVGVRNWALFTDMEFSMTEQLSVHGGLRYDNEIHDYTNKQQINLLADLPDPGSAPPPLQGFIGAVNERIILLTTPIDTASETEFSVFLPKLGATYNWNDDVSTSFTVQRGYRAGGADLSLGPLNEYDPEHTTNYELAWRSLWLEDRVSFNANVFYTDWVDQQVRVEVVPGIFNTQNAGESELYGAEMELNVNPQAGLDIFAGIGYVQTEFMEFTDNNQDYSGNNFVYAPEWTASAGLTKRWDSGWMLSADVNYQDESYGDPANTQVLDSRTVVNAQLAYEFNNFSVSLFARNLLDEEYITAVYARNDTVKVGEPRVIGIQLLGHW